MSEILSKRQWRKVFRDMGVGREKFNRVYEEVRRKKEPATAGKAAVGSLVGMSLLPGLAVAGNPPAEVEVVQEENKKEKEEVSKFLTGTYYQGIRGPSSIRFEGFSNGLPLDLEAYGFLDLECKDKGPDFETLLGQFRLSKKLYKDIDVSSRAVVKSDMEDVAALGLKYEPEMKDGDVLSVEFYPVETDGKQNVYVYGLKKLGKGRFFVDLYFEGTLDDFKPESFYAELGCGLDPGKVGKGLQAVAQGRFASGNYKAFVIGGRYAF